MSFRGLPLTLGIERWQIKDGAGADKYSHKDVKHALAEMLLQRPIGQLLESSTLVNPELTGFLGSFRSGSSCRTDSSAETIDARALDTMHRASLLTSILGRMSNEKLNYVIQAAIGATFLAKGVGTLAWELLTHLKVVPSKATIEKLIDLVAEKVKAAGEEHTSTIAVAAFDNWEKYLRARGKNELKHWVNWFYFAVPNCRIPAGTCPPTPRQEMRNPPKLEWRTSTISASRHR